MHAMRIVTRAGLACAAVALSAATLHAACGPYYKINRLGGSYVGVWAGPASDQTPTRIEFALTFTPLDPLGWTASLQVQWLTVGKDFENLIGLLDCHRSHVVGQAAMIDRDTARYTMIWYQVSNELPEQIVAIMTLSGTMDFDDDGNLVDHSTIRLFLTNDGVNRVAPVVGGPWPYGDADADHDLLPDAGAIPFIEKAFVGALSKRVPLLAP